VDFKGGATFLGLDELPHTSAVITNLADEAALVDRMQDALHGELIRRQELLRSAGNYTSALEYEKARAGAPISPRCPACSSSSTSSANSSPRTGSSWSCS
jgi:S-DNA-T family DNA segregation ATPase FtsK/SpoIIIE